MSVARGAWGVATSVPACNVKGKLLGKTKGKGSRSRGEIGTGMVAAIEVRG